MDSETTPGELRAIQDQVLTLVRQLDGIHTRLRRLQGRIDPGDDEAMIECTAPPSLAFELHGVLDLASEQLAQTTELLRQAGVDTEETVRQQFSRLILKQDAEPAENPVSRAAKRSPGNGSPESGSSDPESSEPQGS